MPSRPQVVAFDVIETLIALEPLRARFVEAGLPGHLLETWFTRTLRDGMTLSATGDFEPFRPVAENALRAVTRFEVGDAAVAHVLDGFATLPAHPDVEPALRRLADAGVRAMLLTNGARATTLDFVERHSLTDLIERVVTVEEVRRWKPPAVVYEHAASVAGVPADRLALVAAHAWDCHGAKRAGLVTGWVSRLERDYSAIFAPPDARGDDLVEVVDALLAL
ncbi:haloacid dehalogenase [Actinomadura sp. NBRC 104412]|uniref:haloacid dehalogenase type II n=1 Tax=Actinomadura sp. NBRC 104412 TaxID=3032203 RepID=UPI0024A3FEF1|nr:haloacid dehalogenase type II [Actinomadura sp. NBRC 104412]GLZ08474.1 haloacid dehalogenase [Actinomadura sp. NBRC 104412]